MQILQYGLYNVKDSYFNDYKNEYLPDNKQENRPYYCAIIDNDGIIWLIPISSQVENYRAKIEKEIAKRGECLFYHIDKFKDEDSVFQIGNTFPVTDKYIKKPFTIAEQPYIIGNINLKKILHSKITKFLILVQQGRLKPNVDILAIKQSLLQ